MMRGGIVVLGSFCLTLGVLINAYQMKKQFYPSVVYITKSNPGMAILYLQAFVFVILMGKLMRKIFFGQLRAAEMEHLIERSWYAITETCLAFTVFRDDFSPKFVALFTVLLFLKCFHWLIEDRVDYMERSPVISFLFHARVLLLVSFLGLLDGVFINNAYYSTLIKGASVQLVFGFEYAILLTIVVHSFTKYILHTLDLQNENTWENKAVYLLYAELVLSFIKVVLYMLFLAIMIKVHTFPLFAIRPMYLTIRIFKKAVNDVIMSRRAISNMNNLYPDATSEELAEGDNVCIICREDMVSGSKKLPCGHIFHTSCLRSWFQRQQTCPTCRMDILRTQGTRDNANQPQQQQQQQGAQQPGAPPQPQGGAPGASSTSAPTSSTTTPPQAFPPGAMPPFMMPPFMMPMPFTVPPPMPPTDFTGLTDEELRAMEGNERRSVEARIEVLRNIQTLLDAAMIQMQQYSAAAARWNTPAAFPSTMTPNSATATTVTTSSAASKTTTPSATAKTADGSSTGNSSVSDTGDQSKKPDVGKDVPDTATKEKDEHGLPEATGGSLPSTDKVLDTKETSGDDTDEVRRRRLQRFMSGPQDQAAS